jgi:hypothetical protein
MRNSGVIEEESDLVIKDEEDDGWFKGGREVVVKDCREDED